MGTKKASGQRRRGHYKGGRCFEGREESWRMCGFLFGRKNNQAKITNLGGCG
jgi:hypothetical protein